MTATYREAYLFRIDNDQRDYKFYDSHVGRDFLLWSLPPRDRRTGGIRQRKDGNPYTPVWDRGDRILLHIAQTDLCPAVLQILGPAKYDARRRKFYTETRITAVEDPPTLRPCDIGIHKAIQGGRHRLTKAEYRAMRERFDPASERET